MRGGGRRDSALLLPRAAVDRRQLPHVPDRGEGRPAEAGRLLRHECARPPPGPGGPAAGNVHQVQDGEEGARRRDGIPADQPSARLPDLRPGRRVRPAGPGDGLRRRRQPVQGEQARRRGQVYRPAGQDDHDALHPLHALHPFLGRSRRCPGTGGDRSRRGHGDHHLSRKGDELGTAGQRHRPLPGRCADLAPLRLPGAAVGTDQDRIDRRHGCARLGDPCRYPRPDGHADPAAAQRVGERGVDIRQGAVHLGRPRRPAARPPVYPPQRPSRGGDVVRGLRDDRREDREHRLRSASRRSPAISPGSRRCTRSRR